MCVFPYIRAGFATCPSNPFTWRCVSARSRCGAERIYNLAVQPQTGIVRVDVRFFRRSVQTFYLHFQPFHVALRVGALPLWCGAT